MSKLKEHLALALGTAFATGVLTYLYASRVEARRFRLEKLGVQLAGKNAIAGNGTSGRTLSVLHLSDLHLVERDTHKAEFLRKATSIEYDLIVLTGDIFENEGGFVHWQSLLAKKPRLGAFAVLGNHDYFFYDWFQKTLGRILGIRRPNVKRDVTGWIASLERAGYRVLQDEMVKLPEAKLCILGVDYPSIDQSRLDELVADVEEDYLLIALFHLPFKLRMLEGAGVKLGFGGHTHGGQIRIPGVGAIFTDSELPPREASGLIWRGNTAFHISRGLSADPRTDFRLFCPPAATIINVSM